MVTDWKSKAISMFSGLKAVMYIFIAALGFTVTYPIYKSIMQLEMSTMAKTTLMVCFWILAITVIYMGTKWAYEGRYYGRADKKTGTRSSVGKLFKE